MPQRKQLAWSELRVGIFVVVGVLLVAVAIFYVTSSSGAFSPKYNLTTYMPDVDGLNEGAPVSLDGIQVGSVDKIRVNPQTNGDKNRSIEIVMRIRRQYDKSIRTDSKASMVTAGVLGDRYVNITRGFTGVALQPNQEIPAERGKDIRDIEEMGATLTRALERRGHASAGNDRRRAGWKRHAGTINHRPDDRKSHHANGGQPG